MFTLDPERARAELTKERGKISPVDPYSDADELNGLAYNAQIEGIVSCEERDAHFAIYPMSLSEPDPVVAVTLGRGAALLGNSMKLRQHEGEDPIAYTVRLLEEMTAEADALVAGPAADGARLDRIAAYMNRPGPWNGADVCELVAGELRESGRELLDNNEGC